MNNLTTRKIVLGLLITLVLAFSVQGVAEAVQRPTVASDALNPTAVYNVGGDAEISIALTLDDDARRETVSISRSSGITFTGDFFGFTGGNLTENDSNGTDNDVGNRYAYTAGGRQRFTTERSITLPINFGTKGKHTVRISSKDYDDGANDDEFSGSWSYTYTYYVKGSGTSRTTTVSLKGLSNGYRQGLFTGTQIEVHSGDSGHYDVTYTTVPDGGIFQIEQPDGSLGALPTNGDEADKGSSVFDVLLTMSRTYQVTTKVTGSDPGVETVGVYIIGTPTLAAGSPDDTDRDGVVDPTAVAGSKAMGGRINQVLPKAFSAHVTDGATPDPGNVPGVVVTFRVRGSGDAGGYLVFDSARVIDPNVGILVSPNNRAMFDTNGNPVTIATEKVLYVRTSEEGLADVDFQLGTDRKQDVTISAIRQSKAVSAYAGETASGNQLVEPSSQISRALGRAGEYELRVKAEDEDGEALPNAYVEFRTSDGELEDPGTGEINTLGRLGVKTDTRGTAFVFFDPKDSSGSPRVTAHLLDLGDPDEVGGTGDGADRVIDDIVFDINGPAPTRTPTPTPTPTPATVTPSLTISVTGTGTTRAATVTATNVQGANVPGLAVALSGTALTTPRVATTGTPETVTLPSTAGDYTLLATAPGFTVARVNLTVAAAPQPGTLTIERVGDRIGNQQSIRVTAQTSDGTPHSGDLTVTLTGAVNPPTVTTLNGRVAVIATLPTTTGAHVLTVSATGYGSDSVIIPAVTAQTADTSQTRDTTVGEADSLEIDGQRRRSGTVNEAAPLRVRVLDANDNGVADVRVTFRVLAPGRGRLSQRGNGRATQDQTDRRGYASANLTPYR